MPDVALARCFGIVVIDAHQGEDCSEGLRWIAVFSDDFFFVYSFAFCLGSGGCVARFFFFFDRWNNEEGRVGWVGSGFVLFLAKMKLLFSRGISIGSGD